jgi:hypothetical protein
MLWHTLRLVESTKAMPVGGVFQGSWHCLPKFY